MFLLRLCIRGSETLRALSRNLGVVWPHIDAALSSLKLTRFTVTLLITVCRTAQS
jgi:hypothetical protein